MIKQFEPPNCFVTFIKSINNYLKKIVKTFKHLHIQHVGKNVKTKQKKIFWTLSILFKIILLNVYTITDT
jgi:hypothetical protein